MFICKLRKDKEVNYEEGKYLKTEFAYLDDVKVYQEEGENKAIGVHRYLLFFYTSL